MNSSNGSVVRVVKDRDYTVMKNIHLKDMRLSLKAIGLLCKVLSLPDNWEYSISGLVAICKEGRDAVKASLMELKEFGYLEINKLQKENGQFYYEYVIHEIPIEADSPAVDSPGVAFPPVDNQPELNINKLNTNKSNINNNITAEAEVPKVSNKSTNQLFKTSSKPKKSKENGYIEVINDLANNENIKNALLDYCNFRRSRGLTVQQWKVIVSDFKDKSYGKTEQQILDCIKQCLVNGRNSLYYSEGYTQNKKNAPPAAIDDSGPSVIRRRKD